MVSYSAHHLCDSFEKQLPLSLPSFVKIPLLSLVWYAQEHTCVMCRCSCVLGEVAAFEEVSLRS